MSDGPVKNLANHLLNYFGTVFTTEQRVQAAKAK